MSYSLDDLLVSRLEGFWDDLLVSRLEVFWKSSESRLDFLKVVWKSSELPVKSSGSLLTKSSDKDFQTASMKLEDYSDDLHVSRPESKTS